MSDAGMETRSEGGKEPVNGDQAGGVEGADGTDAAASEIEEQVKEARVNRKVSRTKGHGDTSGGMLTVTDR